MRLREEPRPEVGGRDRTPGSGEMLWYNAIPKSERRACMKDRHFAQCSLLPLCACTYQPIMHQWFPSVISFMAITLGLASGCNGDLCMSSTVGMNNESYFIS